MKKIGVRLNDQGIIVLCMCLTLCTRSEVDHFADVRKMMRHFKLTSCL